MTSIPQHVAGHPANTPSSRPALAAAALTMIALTAAAPAPAATPDQAALERRVAELQRELDRTKAELAEAKTEAAEANDQASAAQAELAANEPPPADKIRLGPVTVGGAIRANYILGDYPNGGDGPSRGGNGGNFELDVFRINLDLKYQNLVGKFEYRWYDGYKIGRAHV